MKRLTCLILLLVATQAPAAVTAPPELKDLYYGEALFYALQEDWFEALARLDTELEQHRGLDQPELDTLHYHIGQAEFAVGDYELAYRMHQRAGRAITAVIEGDVPDPVRNEALYRLARIYFHKDRPEDALYALNRVEGEVPDSIRDDLRFLRAQVYMAGGRFTEAASVLEGLLEVEALKGFASYNLGIALMRSGAKNEGHGYLDRTGLIDARDQVTRAIRDKANLVLGDKLLGREDYSGAKDVFDRVRLDGPFSNRALLGSGWVDAARGDFERALVPWSHLAGRATTNSAVQEALLAAPYAYGKIGVFSKAAILYGRALEVFSRQIDTLDASITSIREGRFLEALVREELKQDANWVVKLRELPETPETHYFLELMASHDFQESLKNYLDLEDLRKRLTGWETDLDAFTDLIDNRRSYYHPLLPEIDRSFRLLDSQMRLRLEQKEHIEKRLNAMLVVPRPDYLATRDERLLGERITRLRKGLENSQDEQLTITEARLDRLRGVLDWAIETGYDERLTEAHVSLRGLNRDIDRMQRQYDSFVRIRQAATQSYTGYDDLIRRLRSRIVAARDEISALMARQGHMLEIMAENELVRRRQRLEEFQIKARFAMADSYDRAARAQGEKRMAQ